MVSLTLSKSPPSLEAYRGPSRRYRTCWVPLYSTWNWCSSAISWNPFISLMPRPVFRDNAIVSDIVWAPKSLVASFECMCPHQRSLLYLNPVWCWCWSVRPLEGIQEGSLVYLITVPLPQEDPVCISSGRYINRTTSWRLTAKFLSCAESFVELVLDFPA